MFKHDLLDHPSPSLSSLSSYTNPITTDHLRQCTSRVSLLSEADAMSSLIMDEFSGPHSQNGHELWDALREFPSSTTTVTTSVIINNTLNHSRQQQQITPPFNTTCNDLPAVITRGGRRPTLTNNEHDSLLASQSSGDVDLACSRALLISGSPDEVPRRLTHASLLSSTSVNTRNELKHADHILHEDSTFNLPWSSDYMLNDTNSSNMVAAAENAHLFQPLSWLLTPLPLLSSSSSLTYTSERGSQEGLDDLDPALLYTPYGTHNSLTNNMRLDDSLSPAYDCFNETTATADFNALLKQAVPIADNNNDSHVHFQVPLNEALLSNSDVSALSYSINNDNYDTFMSNTIEPTTSFLPSDSLINYNDNKQDQRMMLTNLQLRQLLSSVYPFSMTSTSNSTVGADQPLSLSAMKPALAYHEFQYADPQSVVTDTSSFPEEMTIFNNVDVDVSAALDAQFFADTQNNNKSILSFRSNNLTDLANLMAREALLNPQNGDDRSVKSGTIEHPPIIHNRLCGIFGDRDTMASAVYNINMGQRKHCDNPNELPHEFSAETLSTGSKQDCTQKNDSCNYIQPHLGQQQHFENANVLKASSPFLAYPSDSLQHRRKSLHVDTLPVNSNVNARPSNNSNDSDAKTRLNGYETDNLMARDSIIVEFPKTIEPQNGNCTHMSMTGLPSPPLTHSMQASRTSTAVSSTTDNERMEQYELSDMAWAQFATTGMESSQSSLSPQGTTDDLDLVSICPDVILSSTSLTSIAPTMAALCTDPSIYVYESRLLDRSNNSVSTITNAPLAPISPPITPALNTSHARRLHKQNAPLTISGYTDMDVYWLSDEAEQEDNGNSAMHSTSASLTPVEDEHEMTSESDDDMNLCSNMLDAAMDSEEPAKVEHTKPRSMKNTGINRNTIRLSDAEVAHLSFASTGRKRSAKNQHPVTTDARSTKKRRRKLKVCNTPPSNVETSAAGKQGRKSKLNGLHLSTHTTSTHVDQNMTDVNNVKPSILKDSYHQRQVKVLTDHQDDYKKGCDHVDEDDEEDDEDNDEEDDDLLLDNDATTASKREKERQLQLGRDFTCYVCAKLFSRAFNLKSHMKTHTDERPFVCEHCNKSFARKHDCVRHVRIHTKERPYACEACGKCFARHDALSRHLRVEVQCREV